MEYFLHILILILFYVMLSQSLALVAGYAGLISLCHAGFFGIGAYASAILSTKFGFAFLASLPLAILLCGLTALVISLIALRIVDDYYVILTLGIQVVAFSIMNNWMNLTNGPIGILNIPSISILGFSFDSKLSFLLLTLFFTLFVFLLIKNIIKSPFGRVLIALSEDEIFTKSLGKRVNQAKVISFIVSGMLAAIPGVMYAHYITYIDPASFTIDESIFILSIVIIGGMRNLCGSGIAAAVLVVLPEALRFIGIPSGIASNIRQIIYGLALILIMFNYSKGFVSNKYIGHENK